MFFEILELKKLVSETSGDVFNKMVTLYIQGKKICKPIKISTCVCYCARVLKEYRIAANISLITLRSIKL